MFLNLWKSLKMSYSYATSDCGSDGQSSDTQPDYSQYFWSLKVGYTQAIKHLNNICVWCQVGWIAGDAKHLHPKGDCVSLHPTRILHLASIPEGPKRTILIMALCIVGNGRQHISATQLGRHDEGTRLLETAYGGHDKYVALGGSYISSCLVCVAFSTSRELPNEF